MYLYLPTPLHFLCFCPGLRHHQLSPEQHQSSTDIYSDFLPCTIYSWCSTRSNLLKIVVTPIIPCLKASGGISYFSWSWPVAFGLLTPWNVLLCTNDFSSVKSQKPSHPRKAFLDYFVWSHLPSTCYHNTESYFLHNFQLHLNVSSLLVTFKCLSLSSETKLSKHSSFISLYWVTGLPRWHYTNGKESSCRCRRHKRFRFNLGSGKDPLEEQMATRFSIFAWRTPWTEESGRL